jgi:hypothetical protein
MRSQFQKQIETTLTALVGMPSFKPEMRTNKPVHGNGNRRQMKDSQSAVAAPCAAM